MATHPTGPRDWTPTQDKIRQRVVQLADDANELLNDARNRQKAGQAKIAAGYAAIDTLQNRNARREYPPQIATEAAKAQKLIAEGQREYAEAERDVADAMRYIADISRMLDRTTPKRID